MACPTCNHSLACIDKTPNGTVYHCERCGTCQVNSSCGVVEVYVPKLVQRCRKFESMYLRGSDEMSMEWNTLGIAESIRLPEGLK